MTLRYFITLILGLCSIKFTACNAPDTPSANVFGKNHLALLVSDSALIESLIEDTYDKIMFPLYYDACTTDERTDNLYNPIAVVGSDNAYADEWNQSGKIELCNQLATIIKENTKINDSNRVRWEAELSFLKNMVYYYWVQRFGALNLDSLATGNEFFSSGLNYSSLSETYRFIIDNFQRCATLLPDVCSTERASKVAALAMITRVSLQAAAYVPEERQRYLTWVMQSAKVILRQKEYRIDPDYKGIFNDFSKGRGSREVILEVYKPKAYTTFQHTLMQDLVVNQSDGKMKSGYGPLLRDAFDGWSKRYPTQNLTDAYLVIDNDGGAKKWNETNLYKQYRPGQDYVSSILYTQRDKRFYASIVYDSSSYFNSVVFTRDSGNLSTYARKDGNQLSPTGYYVRKTLYETKKVWYTDATDHVLPVLRLGEVLLNYAEALLLSGNRDSAIAVINITHTLHGGLPPIPSHLPLSLTWEGYKNERRVELFFENDRYWSLLRWAKLNNQISLQELEKPVDAINISANGKKFGITNVPHPVNRKRSLVTQQLLLPLPSAFLKRK